MLRSFSHRSSAKSSAIGYTMGSDINRNLLKFLSNENLFYESYAIVYGLPRKKVYTKLKTLYLDMPFARGYTFLYGSALVRTPTVLYINLDSKCLKTSDVGKALELIYEGHYSLYLATPFTNDSFTTLYRNKVHKLLHELGIGTKLLYPSYTLVVGKSRIFKDSPHSLWSSEILAATLIELIFGDSRVKIDNTACIDRTPALLNGLELIYVEKLVNDLISMLIKRKVIDDMYAKKYLQELVSIT